MFLVRQIYVGFMQCDWKVILSWLRAKKRNIFMGNFIPEMSSFQYMFVHTCNGIAPHTSIK